MRKVGKSKAHGIFVSVFFCWFVVSTNNNNKKIRHAVRKIIDYIGRCHHHPKFYSFPLIDLLKCFILQQFNDECNVLFIYKWHHPYVVTLTWVSSCFCLCYSSYKQLTRYPFFSFKVENSSILETCDLVIVFFFKAFLHCTIL